MRAVKNIIELLLFFNGHKTGMAAAEKGDVEEAIQIFNQVYSNQENGKKNTKRREDRQRL